MPRDRADARRCRLRPIQQIHLSIGALTPSRSNMFSKGRYQASATQDAFGSAACAPAARTEIVPKPANARSGEERIWRRDQLNMRKSIAAWRRGRSFADSTLRPVEGFRVAHVNTIRPRPDRDDKLRGALKMLSSLIHTLTSASNHCRHSHEVQACFRAYGG